MTVRQEEICGHCPKCGEGAYADVVQCFINDWNDHESGVWGIDKYRILRCGGCKAIYFQEERVFSEDVEHRWTPETGEWEAYIPPKIAYWPQPEKQKPPSWVPLFLGIDEELCNLITEIYLAHDCNLRVTTAIALRTVFDKTAQILGADASQGFAQKINHLATIGKVNESERAALTALTNAGSAAAHRGWKPDDHDLLFMIKIMEDFLWRSFFLDDAAKRFMVKIPPDPRKRKS